MDKLKLILSESFITYQHASNGSASDIITVATTPEEPRDLGDALHTILQNKPSEIQVISAYPNFSVVPAGFHQHTMGQDFIRLNTDADLSQQEVMLSVNLPWRVQFYYSIPVTLYTQLKAASPSTAFNFTGEKFLNLLKSKGGREIHILLHTTQCEFFFLEGKNVLLYNNLGVHAEVDYLYFIMFTLSKLHFGTADTHFYVYGETHVHETFISELQKFVRHMKIVFDNTFSNHFLI